MITNPAGDKFASVEMPAEYNARTCMICGDATPDTTGEDRDVRYIITLMSDTDIRSRVCCAVCAFGIVTSEKPVIF